MQKLIITNIKILNAIIPQNIDKKCYVFVQIKIINLKEKLKN